MPGSRHTSSSEIIGLSVGLLLAAPVLGGLIYVGSRALQDADSGYSLTRLISVATDPAVQNGLFWSLYTSTLATILATGLAILLALVLRQPFTSRSALRSLAVVPLPIPHLVAGFLAFVVLSQHGILSRILSLGGAMELPVAFPILTQDTAGVGVVLALVWKETPFLFLAAAGVLAQRGTALEEAARSLGAGPTQTVYLVTLPLLLRGMAPAIVAVFAFAVGSYEIGLILGPNQPLAAPVLLLERHLDPNLANRADADVLGLMLLMLALLTVLIHEWFRHQDSKELQ